MMQRRKFLRAGLAASALTLAGKTAQGSDNDSNRKIGQRTLFELRAYKLKLGASASPLHTFLEHALMPALAARGLANVGVFNEIETKEGETIWLLISHPNFESVLQVTAMLNGEPGIKNDAGDYWKTTTKVEPAFDRIDSWLLLAFAGMPELNVPELSRKKAPRILELRTYESFSEERALKKVEMFNSGEIGAMHEVGLAPVFFGQALLGRGLPQLTYLLSGSDRMAHAEHWKGFNAHPVWQKLKADPAFAETVSKVISRFLVPTSYSQL